MGYVKAAMATEWAEANSTGRVTNVQTSSFPALSCFHYLRKIISKYGYFCYLEKMLFSMYVCEIKPLMFKYIRFFLVS